MTTQEIGSVKRLLVTVGLVTMVAAASVVGGIVAIFIANKTDESNTATDVQGVSSSIPDYYPKSLPPSYTIAPLTTNQAEVRSYVIQDQAGTQLPMTVQQLPAPEVLQKLHTEQFAFPETIAVSSDTSVTIGQVRGQYMASYTDSKVWVLLTAPLSVNYNDFVSIATSLRQR